MSVEAEQHLIASAIIDEKKIPELLEISEDWFSLNQHKLIYRTLEKLAKNSLGTDLFALADTLKRERQLEMAGGMDYLVELSDSLPNLKYWDSYKNSLFGSYKVRQITNVAENLQMQIGTGARPEEMVDYMQKSLIDLLTDHHRGGLKPLTGYLDQALGDIQWRLENEGKMRGHQTGFKELDETLDGFEPGKVYVVAGRTSMGKTQFGLNLSLRLARQKPVCVFSLEMTGKGLSMRAICNESRVFNSKIKRGDMTTGEMDQIAQAVTRLHMNSKLFIDETPGLSIAQMRSRLKAFQLAHGDIGAIVVDHIGLVRKDGRKSETEGLTQVSHELSHLAKEFNAPMIELVQINRAAESLGDKRPAIANLKQSGAIEEDARVIMLLYRDEYYNPDTPDKDITEVNIAKNSDGETKTLYFRHNMGLAHYEEIAGYEPAVTETKKKF